ncbi:DUF4870 domain-containing protein [Dyella sp.]|uniref:DUF4870 domain-containing protein n=1 Tax=Dyella sp. TaxID=1869338 RepID=UPI002ED645E0
MSVPPETGATSPQPPYEAVHVGPGSQERQWALFAHLSALAGCIITGPWAGWGCFLGPLIIWLIKKDTMPFVDDQGKEALNFNITMAILCVALVIITVITFGLGIFVTAPIGFIAGIAWLVLTIVAAIKANEGVRYRYPFTLRLIK